MPPLSSQSQNTKYSRRQWLGLSTIGCLALGVQGCGSVWTSSNVFNVKIVNEFPHQTDAYCQGLVYYQGDLYESTGQFGESTVRHVELKTGKVLKQHALDDRFFGEGLARWKNTLVQVTWKSEVGYVYDLNSLDIKKSFTYTGQGWGLTNDDNLLYLSNGTSTIQKLDPTTLKVVGKFDVKDDDGNPISKINELEWIEGEIWANIFQTDSIIKINPQSGIVTGLIECKNLWPADDRPDREQVLNGIAYDPKEKRIFVTGKYWPKLYEVQVVPA